MARGPAIWLRGFGYSFLDVICEANRIGLTGVASSGKQEHVETIGQYSHINIITIFAAFL